MLDWLKTTHKPPSAKLKVKTLSKPGLFFKKYISNYQNLNFLNENYKVNITEEKFDLLIDGNFAEENDYDADSADEDDADDDDMTPYDEFIKRSYPTRDAEWNNSIRFRSGYLPKAPFVRDPGDYIKAETQQGLNPEEQELYAEFDPDDRYYNQVFQKQTEKERYREKFEGKMVIADWPSPEYIDSQADNAPQTRADDAGENLRIMVLGHFL